MRILNITNGLSEGGVESLLCDILPALISNECIVDILVLDKKRLGLKNELERNGITVYYSRWSSIYNPLNIFVIRKYLLKYNLVHVHLFPAQYYAVLAKCLVWGKRVILMTTEHNTYNHRRKYLIFKLIDRFVYSNFKEVISITKGTADNLKKWAGIESKVIYNGICLDKIIHFAAKGISRQTLNIPEDAFLCVMVARFNEQKDQDTVIRAMKKLPLNFYLLLVGSGERQIVCEKLVEEIEVSERVCFVGYSQYPSIYISISDVGILSSHWEGFGISALEYMALGKPTVVTNVDGLKEVVGNAALLFTPHNENELADKIYALYCDRILYNRMKVISKLHVLNFDVKETARQYLVEYQKFF